MDSIHNDVLGTLTYNTDYEVFVGKTNFGESQIEIRVYFSLLPNQISEKEVGEAQDALLGIISRKKAIEAEIVNEYLDLYNESWRDGEIISREEFFAVLEPESVGIRNGQPYFLWYVAGDLFTDHGIEVRFGENGTIREMALG